MNTQADKAPQRGNICDKKGPKRENTYICTHMSYIVYFEFFSKSKILVNYKVHKHPRTVILFDLLFISGSVVPLIPTVF